MNLHGPNALLFRGLIEQLPEPGSVWSMEKRQAWLALAQAIFDLCYTVESSDPNGHDSVRGRTAPAEGRPEGQEGAGAPAPAPSAALLEQIREEADVARQEPVEGAAKVPGAMAVLQPEKPYQPPGRPLEGPEPVIRDAAGTTLEDFVEDAADQLRRFGIPESNGNGDLPAEDVPSDLGSIDHRSQIDDEDFPHGPCKQCHTRPAISDRGRYAKLCTVCKGDIQAPPIYDGYPLTPERLRLERTKRDWSQQRLAEKAGVRVNVIKRCESPHLMATYGHPTAPTWQQITNCLRESIGEIKAPPLPPLPPQTPEAICLACGRQSLPGPFGDCLLCKARAGWKPLEELAAGR